MGCPLGKELVVHSSDDSLTGASCESIDDGISFYSCTEHYNNDTLCEYGMCEVCYMEYSSYNNTANVI